MPLRWDTSVDCVAPALAMRTPWLESRIDPPVSTAAPCRVVCPADCQETLFATSIRLDGASSTSPAAVSEKSPALAIIDPAWRTPAPRSVVNSWMRPDVMLPDGSTSSAMASGFACCRLASVTQSLLLSSGEKPVLSDTRLLPAITRTYAVGDEKSLVIGALTLTVLAMSSRPMSVPASPPPATSIVPRPVSSTTLR